MNYDALLFGNGLTLNLLYQLKPYIPEDKHYLFSTNAFLQHWINGNLTSREENRIYSAIYGNQKNMQKKIELIKKELILPVEKYSSDLEYFLGDTLFDSSVEAKSLKDIKTVFPILYNIWYILLMEYLQYRNCDSKIQNYYDQVRQMTGNPQYIWTTNFDLFGESIHPEHLHGRFVQPLNRYEDVIFHTFKFNFEEKEEKNFRFKYIWGHNGIGKQNLINKLHSYSDSSKFFDFGFFFDDDIKMSNMLIYGMGFRDSGYIQQLKSVYPRYNKPALGGIIDEHILLRIRGLQDTEKLEHLDVTYFDEAEQTHLQEVLDECQIKKYRLIKCQDFNFHV